MAELIKQQPTPVRIPSREEAATDALVTSLLGPTELVPPVSPARRRRARNARIARVAGCCRRRRAGSSITGAAILAANRPPNAGVPVSERPFAVRRERLRPDVLSAQLPSEHTPLRTAPEVPMPQPSALLLAPPAEPSAEPSAETATPLVSTGPQPQVDVVKKFYELLTTKPNAAAKLLSPDLVGTDPKEFVESWGMIRTVNVDQTSLRPDGTVLAVVSMQELNGSWLRLEQLFWLTDTTQPRIIGTEVLSAQRH
ncbi:hypothetical protein BBK82_18095 [Lentzea guizhouensis]|uniref:Uncharacterized protein n=1 Tax=Lentzea guizhouensis TaxID=1586287 RepID=A0A1B2HIY6_9PSEU|nr:hypothetical protein BBK82_18095 [Lentzea guizhouensis]